jgi:hypothetical protein
MNHDRNKTDDGVDGSNIEPINKREVYARRPEYRLLPIRFVVVLVRKSRLMQ